MGRIPLDLAGQRFGRLVALRSDRAHANHKRLWVCRCDCGREVEVLAVLLKRGQTQSCGCMKADRNRDRLTTHGHAGKDHRRSRAYKLWAGIKRRCDNPNDPNFPRYGGRGIAYDPRWADFAAFLADMGEPPDGYSIERDDPNGGYHKGNCRWIPREAQALNRRDTHWIEYGGERKPMAEWARVLGIPYKALHGRIMRRGWSVERAFTQPYR